DNGSVGGVVVLRVGGFEVVMVVGGGEGWCYSGGVGCEGESGGWISRTKFSSLVMSGHFGNFVGIFRLLPRKVRYAVRSPCTLKSPLKKFYVDVASDDDEPKGKGKEKEADDFEDPEADSEETCKRIKKGRNGDDESDDNDGNGDGAGAHTNLSNLSLGEGLVAGN
ncbi:hypothetical protein Tco_1566580, partial [Tanacetum coccineum]